MKPPSQKVREMSQPFKPKKVQLYINIFEAHDFKSANCLPFSSLKLALEKMMHYIERHLIKTGVENQDGSPCSNHQIAKWEKCVSKQENLSLKPSTAPR